MSNHWQLVVVLLCVATLCTIGPACKSGDRPVLEITDHLYLGEVMDQAAVAMTSSAEKEQASVVLGTRELQDWTYVDCSKPQRVGNLLEIGCNENGYIASPEGWSVDADEIDYLLLALDTGMAKDAQFEVIVRRSDGGEINQLTRAIHPGVNTYRVRLRELQGWDGRITRLILKPNVGGSATARLQSLEFGSQYKSLCSAGSGWSEVLHGGQYRLSMFGTVPSSFRYRIRVPRGARLSLGMGVLGGGGDVHYRVVATDRGTPVPLVDELISTSEGWRDRTVSLDEFAGRTIDLRLETESGTASGVVPTAVACWSDPTIRTDRVRKPGILFYLVDTLRADHLEPYGYKKIATPNVSRLARRSILYERCIAPGNRTIVSVPSILTGTPISTHGLPFRQDTVALDIKTLAEILRKEGYLTASFITNRIAGHQTGLNRGYSILYDLSKTWHDRDSPRTLPEPVLSWLEEHREEPLFVYIHTAEPHDPYNPAPPFRVPTTYTGPIEGFKDSPNSFLSASTPEEVEYVASLYDGEVRLMDYSLGLFLDKLDDLGMYDDSIVAFTSDHGEELFDHGSWTHGRSLYQDQVHVPFLLHLPDDNGNGSRVVEPVMSIDIVPTLLGAVGIKSPPSVLGRNLLQKGDAPSAPAVSEDFRPRRKDYRKFAAQTTDWKVIRTETGGASTVEVYDLRADLGEKHDLSKAISSDARQVLAVLEQHIVKVGSIKENFKQRNAVVDSEDLKNLKALGYIK